VAFFAEIVQLFGIPKSVGQIYGLLYASPQSLGFTAIVERLEISKGSASQGLQLLRSLGAINEAEQKDGTARGVAYEAELSLRQLVTGVLQERLAPLASAGAQRLKRLKDLAAQAPENTAFYLDRTKQLENWRKRFTTVTPLLTALLGPSKKKSR
jgi:DNA-binding transcriptional regulator GbsR (MarR family)